MNGAGVRDPLDEVRRVGGQLGRRAFAVLGFWGVLASIGAAPTVAAVLAFASGATAGVEPRLLVIVLVSLAANIILALVAIRLTRYAGALEADMELIGNTWRQRAKPADPWLPGLNGDVPLSNKVLDEAYDNALALAREKIAHDARLGLAWIDLSRPYVAFTGFSEAARKRFRLWTFVGPTSTLAQVERSGESSFPIEPLHWRTDPAWSELLRQSWLAEFPFAGSVVLWPRFEHARIFLQTMVTGASCTGPRRMASTGSSQRMCCGTTASQSCPRPLASALSTASSVPLKRGSRIRCRPRRAYRRRDRTGKRRRRGAHSASQRHRTPRSNLRAWSAAGKQGPRRNRSNWSAWG